MARNRVLAVAGERAQATAARDANKAAGSDSHEPGHLYSDPTLEPLLAKLPVG